MKKRRGWIADVKYGILCLIHVNRGVSLLFFLNREEDLQLELFVYSLCEQERPALTPEPLEPQIS